MNSSPPPILIRSGEMLDIKGAAKHCGRSEKTVRRWVKSYPIACQSLGGGPFTVSAIALTMVMHGDMEALELLRAGHRSAPAVRRYLDFLGLPE